MEKELTRSEPRHSIALCLMFPLLVLAQGALFQFIDLLSWLWIELMTFLVGIIMLVWAIALGASQRDARSAKILALTLCVWLTWILVPLSEISAVVRFHLEKSSYDEAVAQSWGGAQPACLVMHKCGSDLRTPPTLFFPYDEVALPDAMSYGVIYAPNPDAPALSYDPDRCGLTWALAPHYCLGHFW